MIHLEDPNQIVPGMFLLSFDLNDARHLVKATSRAYPSLNGGQDFNAECIASNSVYMPGAPWNADWAHWYILTEDEATLWRLRMKPA